MKWVNTLRSAMVRAAAAALALGGCATAALAMPGQAPAAVVGEATLVIGNARIVNALGQAAAVEKGAAVRVGDQIETGAGGHVLLRFVDGARVSVRPGSRLRIENYAHSDASPTLNAIKFELQEGVVRSITGAWGEAARERFRLNTPMAAIGIKGTDFIVRSAADSTLVTVYSGAVLMTPLAQACRQTLGPCFDGNEKMLTEDMRGQMLEVSRQYAAAQLVPADAQESVRTRRGALASADQSRQGKLLVAETQTDASSDKAAMSEARGATVALAQGALPQLVWGRFAQPIEGDRFSLSFQEARQNRESTVGNGVYGLYREPSLPDAPPVAQMQADARFQLTNAMASLKPHGLSQAQAVQVQSGALNVDFSRATFATTLNLSGATVGAQTLNAQGVVLANGIFQSRTGDAFVAGAFSHDTREAGYFFDKSIPAGALTGITLWGR